MLQNHFFTQLPFFLGMFFLLYLQDLAPLHPTPLFLTLEWHCSLCFDLGFHINFLTASLPLFYCEYVFLLKFPVTLKAIACVSCCSHFLLCIWPLMPFGFFLLLTFSSFIFCDWCFFVRFRLELPLLSLPGVTKLLPPFPAIHLQPLPLTHRYILHYSSLSRILLTYIYM